MATNNYRKRSRLWCPSRIVFVGISSIYPVTLIISACVLFLTCQGYISRYQTSYGIILHALLCYFGLVFFRFCNHLWGLFTFNEKMSTYYRRSMTIKWKVAGKQSLRRLSAFFVYAIDMPYVVSFVSTEVLLDMKGQIVLLNMLQIVHIEVFIAE